jgi:cysteinyl-tRNA synthetase
MQHEWILLQILSFAKRNFVPLVPGHVGMYVCGPTVAENSPVTPYIILISFFDT